VYIVQPLLYLRAKVFTLLVDNIDKGRTVHMVHGEKGFIGRYPDFITDGNPPCTEMDPELYFPDKGGAGATQYEFKMAKSICRKCPYTTACLNWAVDNGEVGIWGGTTERERRVLRKKRRAVA
jgi:WhiB family redox-sensing transcriptional regulator